MFDPSFQSLILGVNCKSLFLNQSSNDSLAVDCTSIWYKEKGLAEWVRPAKDDVEADLQTLARIDYENTVEKTKLEWELNFYF